MIKDGLKPLGQIIKQCRECVAHFSSSPKATAAFRKKQVELNLPGVPVHKLLQDVTTRWNSTYYMLERIYEQRTVLAIFVDEQGTSIPLPKRPEWLIISELLTLLRPFEEATKGLSAHTSCLSQCIPLVRALRKMLVDRMDDFQTEAVS